MAENPRAWRLHPAVTFVLLLCLYAATSPRTVALEDDGYFILSSYFFGVGHAPGYPLFTLIGKVFTWLPFGGIAYRVHLVSAVFGAATCAILWCLVRRITRSHVAAYTAALAYGVSPVFWSQSIIAEVYTLNTFLFFLLFLICYHIQLSVTRTGTADGDSPPERLIVFSGFVAGLGLSNHWPLLTLASPALLVLVWPARRYYLQRWPRVLGALACGLAPYAWMVLRSQMDPQMSFLGPIESWREFWSYFNREVFAATDDSMSAGWSDRAQYAGFLAWELARQFTPVGLAAGLFGLWSYAKEGERRLGAALLAALLSTPVLIWALLNFDYDVQYQSVMRVYPLVPYGALALMIGLGTAALSRRIRKFGERQLAAGVGVLVTAATLLLTGTVVQNTRAGYTWSREYAAAVLNTVPEGSALFVYGDIPTSLIGYFHYVEGWRPDIKVYSKQGLWFRNRLFRANHTIQREQSDALNAFIERSERPVFLTECHDHPEYRSIHMGLYCYIDKEETGADGYQFDQRLFDYLASRNRHKDLKDPWSLFHRNDLFVRFGFILGAMDQTQDDLPPERYRRLVVNDFYGGLGFVDGLMENRDNAERVLELVTNRYQHVPPGIHKKYPAKIYDALAWSHLQLGRYERTVQYLRAAIEEYPHLRNEAVAHLVTVYRQLGKQKECRALLDRFGVGNAASHCQAGRPAASVGPAE